MHPPPREQRVLKLKPQTKPGILGAGRGRPHHRLPDFIVSSPVASPGRSPEAHSCHTTISGQHSREGGVAMASGTWRPARNGSRRGHSLQLRQGQVLRACVLRQLLSWGWHHRPMATGSRLPGVWPRASVLLPLSFPAQSACQPAPGSQDAARVFIAEPLNYAAMIPPPAETVPERPD